MNPSLPAWRQTLFECIERADRAKSSHDQSAGPVVTAGKQWATFSTIRAHPPANTTGEYLRGRPACRTVALRALTPTNVETACDEKLFRFVTDTRSSKICDLRENPFAELVMFFPSRMTQLRISGRALIVPDDSDIGWRTLPPHERQWFMWPPPGVPTSNLSQECGNNHVDTQTEQLPEQCERYTQSTDAVSKPQNFAVCMVIPDYVETLELAALPFKRIVYEKDDSGTWSDAIRVSP